MYKKLFKAVVLGLVLAALIVPATVEAAPILPEVSAIRPKHPAPGQEITIFGSNFIVPGDSCSDSNMQVWFVSSQGGVNWVMKTPEVQWNASSIKLNVPVNLVPGETYRVTVIRCGYGSVTTPYYLRLSPRRLPKG